MRWFLIACGLLSLTGCALWLLTLSGCAINSQDLQGISHETEIASDPPGARIEINNEYIGTTPMKLVIPRRYQSEFLGWINGGTRITAMEPLRIVAYPVAPGQYTQMKYIGNEPTPWRLFFDMHLEPAPGRHEIKEDVTFHEGR